MDRFGLQHRVQQRVEALDPDNSTKIMGYFMLQDNGDDIYRMALGSDVLLQSMMAKAKKDLGLTSRTPQSYEQLLQQHFQAQLSQSPNPLSSMSLAPSQLSSMSLADQERLRRISDEFAFNFHEQHLPEKLASIHDKLPQSYHDKLPQSYHDQLFLHDQVSLQDQLYLSESPDGQMPSFPHEQFYPEAFAFLNTNKINAEHLYSRSSSRRNSSIVDSTSPTETGPAHAWKPCLYFARGYCKHGSNCRFLHGPVSQNSGSSSSATTQRDMRAEEGIASGSLERLEMELQELLRGRRAPVSIASLPQLYYERFGKTLQAEGYLTESQRHGKAGYSLTKLLARLKNTVTLIDRHKHTAAFLNRPHGQHAVVLAEDAHRFTAFRGEHDGLSGVNPSSRQIYLTFPAESSFTEEDVTSHFRAYGPVQDVRIPYQQKRMFGFVTFVYSETVKTILSEGNPHYICGARVLVKPYREKGKHGDRKYSERGDHPRYQQSRSMDSKDFDYTNPPTPKYFDDEESFSIRFDEDDQSPYPGRRRLMSEFHLPDAQRLPDVQRRRAEVEVAVQQAQAQAQAQGHVQGHVPQVQQGLSNGVYSSDELSMSAEEPQFHSDNLEYLLMEVLDGENGDEGDSTAESYGMLPPSGNVNHNLPESPFTSPHALNKQMGTFSLQEKMKNLSLGAQQSASWTSYHGGPTLFASNVF